MYQYPGDLHSWIQKKTKKIDVKIQTQNEKFQNRELPQLAAGSWAFSAFVDDFSPDGIL